MSRPQIVIFGASGDLARRKLLPALTRLSRERDLSLLGVARGEHSDDSFREELSEALPGELREAFAALAPNIHYQQADVSERASFEKLGARLDELAEDDAVGRLYYLALQPSLFPPTLTGLDDAGLLAGDDEERAWRRVVFEKPFGHDRESAVELDRHVHRLLREDQVFRIDHYLGKETVQNLLGLRFHNAIFEPIWSRHHVELVQISVAEQIGVSPGRADYYDDAGALRDVMQNHMLQLLALAAMEAPPSLEPEAIREQKVALLRALWRPEPEEVGRQCVRARYAAGRVEGEPVPAYAELEGVDPDAGTETYVALRAEIDNWRWKGVPFLLRHGKRLAKRFTEIQVQFRTPPLQLFNRPEGMSESEFRRGLRDGSLCRNRPNRLILRLQPDEGIELAFGVKEPGPEMRMAPAVLDFDYRGHFEREPPDAYERLLLDALRGDPTLFLRADEVETCWRFVDAIRAGWDRGGEGAPPLLEYPAGSWGPREADALFGGCEGEWSRGE